MTLVFWLSVVAVLYVYAGYPLLLRAWAWYCGLRIAECGLIAERGLIAKCGLIAERGLIAKCGLIDEWPAVSIVIAARNESHRLAARIDNLLSLDYPAGKRQIIVVSDGSTDDTLDVLARYGAAVEAVAIAPSGKAVALNEGVARARHDIVVFADARQVFEPAAL